MTSSKKSAKKPAKQTVISDQEVELMDLIDQSSTPMPTYIIAAELGSTLGNAHNKLTRMQAKGFLQDQEADDDIRDGLHTGEKRRVWTVTSLGRDASDLHRRVMEAQGKLYAEQGPSDTTRPEILRKASKRHT